MSIFGMRAGIAVAGAVGGMALLFYGINSANAVAAPARPDAGNMVRAMTLNVMNWVLGRYALSQDELPADLAHTYVIIDLRERADYERDHLPGAVNIPERHIVAEIGARVADPDQPILIYGYDEDHSIRSVVALRLFAYNQVFHVRGGRSGPTPAARTSS